MVNGVHVDLSDIAVLTVVRSLSHPPDNYPAPFCSAKHALNAALMRCYSCHSGPACSWERTPSHPAGIYSPQES